MVEISLFSEGDFHLMEVATLITHHSYTLERIILQTKQSPMQPLDGPWQDLTSKTLLSTHCPRALEFCQLF